MIRTSIFHNLKLSLCYPSRFLFSQKKLNKLIIEDADYLKDNTFDTDVKTEWAKKQTEYQKEKASKHDARKILDEKLKEVEKDYKEAESILRSFKDKLRVDETNNIEQASNKHQKEFLSMAKMHFQGKSNEETKARAKRFKDFMRLKQDWSPLSHLSPKISDNYGNYTQYKNTYPILKDKLDNNTNQKINQEEFQRNVSLSSIEKMETMKRKDGSDFVNTLKNEEQKIDRNEDWKLASRKERFPGSDPYPHTLEEFKNKIEWKKTFNRQALHKEKDKLLSKKTKEDEDEDFKIEKKLPKNLIKRTRLEELQEKEDLEAIENEQKEEGNENKGRSGGLMGEDEFDEMEEDVTINKQDKMKKRGSKEQEEKGPASSETEFGKELHLEYQSLLQAIKWDKDAIDVDEDEDQEGTGETDKETDPFQNNNTGRVSPWAREEIFRLFMEGWSVRDISLRYCIIPERVKAIVWMRKTFYDEVFPRVDITTVRLGLEREMMYGEDWAWVDFGLDMSKMIERERGVPLMDFKHPYKTIDTKAEEEVEKRMAFLLERKTKKKQDRVTEGFIGSGNSGYIMKSWIVYKGHGSERVNRAFKKAVHFSDRRYRLCKNIGKKIKEGPRYASLGFGIK